MTSVTTKRGRPVLDEAERRTKHAETWLSPAEHDHLLASAGKQRPADFLRGLALQDWTPSAAQQSGRRGRPAQARRVQFRLTFTEQERLKSLAERVDLPVADYIRLILIVQSGFDAEKHVLRLEVRPGLGKQLAELAAQNQQTVAEYVLAAAEAGPPTTGKAVVTDEVLMRADALKHSLDRIGNNLNQIAKAGYAGRDLPGLSQAAAVELTAERKRAAEILEELASHYAW